MMNLFFEIGLLFSVGFLLALAVAIAVPRKDTPQISEAPSTASLPLQEKERPLDPFDIREVDREQAGKITEKEGHWGTILSGIPEKRVVYGSEPVFSVKTSPLGKQLGFFYEVPEEIAGRDIVLIVLDLETKRTRELYRGDYHTSSWEWNAEKYITVRRGCGTECLYARMIDVGTGKDVLGYHVYDPPVEK